MSLTFYCYRRRKATGTDIVSALGIKKKEAHSLLLRGLCYLPEVVRK